jgi:hypothetical protein
MMFVIKPKLKGISILWGCVEGQALVLRLVKEVLRLVEEVVLLVLRSVELVVLLALPVVLGPVEGWSLPATVPASRWGSGQAAISRSGLVPTWAPVIRAQGCGIFS